MPTDHTASLAHLPPPPTPHQIGVYKINLDQFYGAALGEPKTVEGWFPLRKSLRGKIHIAITVVFNIPAAAPGMVMPLPSLRNPIFGIGLGWDFSKKQQPIDLDASLLVLGADLQLQDTISFQQVQDKRAGGQAIRHSGDDRSGEGDGDDETIFVAPGKVNSGDMHLVVVVNAYSGETLDAVRHAYVRVWAADVPSSEAATLDRMVTYGKAHSRTACFYSLTRVPKSTGLFFGVLSRRPCVDAADEWTFATHVQPVPGNVAGKSVAKCVELMQRPVMAAEGKTGDSGQRPETNLVRFHIKQARNLNAADGGMFRKKSSDPYVVVQDVKGLAGDSRGTAVVRKNLNPVWNEEIECSFNYKLSGFLLKVLDHDDRGADDPLGHLVLPLSLFYGGRLGEPVTVEGWYPLTNGGKGELLVAVTVTWRIPAAVPGSLIPLPVAPQYTVALGWDMAPGGSGIDVDVGMLILDDAFALVDFVSGSKMQAFGGGVQHSGDDTTGDGGGDDESVTVSVPSLPANARYMTVVITSKRGVPLNRIQVGVRVRFVPMRPARPVRANRALPQEHM